MICLIIHKKGKYRYNQFIERRYIMTNVINELHTDLYINGEWVTTQDKKDVINPATGETIAQIAQANEAQVEEAIQTGS